MTQRMPLADSLHVLKSLREDADVVVATMGAAREWMKLGMHRLDFIYAPSAMGEAPLVGLGIALAQPWRRVFVCNGDGCLLMNLGCLVSITAAAPVNYTLLLFDNAVYEVTGGQATAADARVRRGGAVDYCNIARGCGFETVHDFSQLEVWQTHARRVLCERGPRFIRLAVEPVPGGEVPRSPGPPPARARDFAAALALPQPPTSPHSG